MGRSGHSESRRPRLVALEALGPGDKDELIDGPQPLLGPLMRLKALAQSRWPRKQTNSPVGDTHILVCLVGLLVRGIPGIFDQVGVQRQFRFTQLPPHVATRIAIGHLDLKRGRSHLVRFASLDNVLCGSPRPFEESLIVVGVEPAIDQSLMRACADGLLISLVENGKKVAVLLESVYRLLDPLAQGSYERLNQKGSPEPRW